MAKNVNPPKQIVQAVNLVWLSLSLEMPLNYFHAVRVDENFTFSMDYTLIILMILATYVNLNTLKGKNWARMTQLALALIGWAGSIYYMDEFVRSGLPEQLINVISPLLDIAIVYNLFSKPGKYWFAKDLKEV
jgi:predicted membrane channel-forming protein YqfA (hemolysin III family)